MAIVLPISVLRLVQQQLHVHRLGVLDGTDCKLEIATSCTGTMSSLVTSTTVIDKPDPRKIYMNVSGVLGRFYK